MKKPVCVSCGKGMTISKGGVTVVELYLGDQYYKVWPADVAKCPDCGIEVTTGYPHRPIMEAHDGQPKIREYLESQPEGYVILEREY